MATMQNENDVMTAEELSALLRLSLPVIYARAQSGDIPGQRIGAQWRFSRRAIEELLSKSTPAKNKGATDVAA